MVRKIKVLSLFDGISCGMVALERAGIPVEKYYSYEIEPSAIKISKKNYPNIIQCGDVFDTDFCQFAIQNIDLLIGGSPCTFWSKARGKNREIDTSGMGYKLFSKFAEALHNVQPKYFLYENNYGIDKTIVNSISEQLIDPTNWNKYKIISPVEAERLQTLPDNYTEVEGVRKAQRFAAIGNGWTVDVIAHILKGLKKEVS